MTSKELFEQNQQLVPFVYWKYFSKFIELKDDLISEGYLALWKACLNFDESKGVAFSTYAVPMVWGQMKRYLREKSTTVRVPRAEWGKDDAQYVCLSLDSIVPNADELTLGDMIPVEDPMTDEAISDLIDSLCATIERKRDRDIVEEYLYGLMFDEAPRQIDLSEKYKLTQPTIAKIIKKYLRKFQKLL